MLKMFLMLIVMGVMAGACAGGGGRQTLEEALPAPRGTVPAAATANEEGIKLFYKRQWEPAKQKFEAAIQAQPTLAEAHYNLGLVYDAMRNDKEARKHFIEAANLAPGNKEIWNSPALRSHGNLYIPEKSGSIFSEPKHHH